LIIKDQILLGQLQSTTICFHLIITNGPHPHRADRMGGMDVGCFVFHCYFYSFPPRHFPVFTFVSSRTNHSQCYSLLIAMSNLLLLRYYTLT